METPEYLPPNAAYFRAGAAQFACEKQQQAKAAGGAGGDHFIVEDLFDFSNDGDEEEEGNGLGGGDEQGGPDGNTDSSTVIASDTSPNSSSGSDHSCNGGGGDLHFDPEAACFADVDLSGELCVPYDELADLEWLSNLVDEDDFSTDDLQKLHLITGSGSLKSSSGETLPQFSTSTAASIVTTETTALASEKPVGKSRSKRSRAAPSNWASRLLVLNPTIDTCSADSELIVPQPEFPPPIAPAKKAPKVLKKKEGQDGLAPAPDGRKCLHCATDKTPQWRTGPMGPKTLCNACGVRYKSGRLVPEYRPAASPTFVLSKHSNSHRKVMELRRQKEIVVQQPCLQLHGGAQFLHSSNHQHHGSAFFEAAGAGGEDFLIHQHVGPDFRQLI